MDGTLTAVERLDNWIEDHHFQAYDPFDGLNSWLSRWAIGKLGRQLLLQTIRRLPWNLRPLLGIQPACSSKAMGYFARAYLRLHRLTNDQNWKFKADQCLKWLEAHQCLGYETPCWGNHFDYESRVFSLPRGEPTVVWTALIGHAFVDSWEMTGREQHLEMARSICRFITEDLQRFPEPQGLCISYIPTGYYAVHNANMLAAAHLSRTYAHTGEDVLKDIASDAVAYTVHSQRDDGSWWYGEARNLRWIDSFHTGYVLDSLWWYMQATGDWSYQPAFQKGSDFFVRHFFEENGAPKYYHNRTYPLDIQCAAQAIDTLTMLQECGHVSPPELAERVADWTLANMQAPDGHFYFRRGRLWVNKTPMLHWGQATMLHALSCLLERREHAS